MERTRLNPNKHFEFIIKVNGEIVGEAKHFYRDALLPFNNMVKDRMKSTKKDRKLPGYQPMEFLIEKVEAITNNFIEIKRIMFV